MKEKQILCLQEHWLHDFEKKNVNCNIPEYDSVVRCWDLKEKISNFKARRGKGCELIMWPKEWLNV